MNLNIYSVVFLIINGGLLLWLPRRWAPFPLLVGACYMTLGQGLLIGVFHFPIIRLLIAIGLIRVIVRGERMAGGINGLDWLMLIYSAWTLISSIFHNDLSGAFVNRLGITLNAFGIYFLLRVFCQSVEDVETLCRFVAILLIPIAIEMLYEKISGYNLFSELGGVSAISQIREGRIRASGPFAHPILAGTIGAVSLPILIGIWRQHRIQVLAGIVACLSIIIASSSSGPIMSAVAGIAALFMWRYRLYMRLVRWFAILSYIFLAITMNASVYYIIARIDLVGGSTGWHRSALIESAFNHLQEWWFAGTDYTRHWMPTGVSWSPDHTDITNHYLQLGVLGGLPLMFLFITILAKGFSFVGKTVEKSSSLPIDSQFMVWALGSTLFAHAATMISVSYFDQSVLFLYLTLAAIGSIGSGELA